MGGGNDYVGLHLSTATHPQKRVNNTDYCVTFMYSSWLPAILQSIEKSLNENYVWTFIFLFPLLSVVLPLRDILKTYLSKPKREVQAVVRGGTATWPLIATALVQTALTKKQNCGRRINFQNLEPPNDAVSASTYTIYTI